MLIKVLIPSLSRGYLSIASNLQGPVLIYYDHNINF